MSTADSLTLATLLEHRDWVRSLARSLVSDPSLADDIAQKTMLEAVERPPAGGVRNPRGWLSRVARNAARGEKRSEGRRRTREEAVARPELQSDDPATAVDRAFAHRRVVDVLLSLDEPYRTVLTRRFFEGEDPREISKQLERPLATVRSQIQRGLSQMREQLDRESGGDRSVWVASLLPLVEVPSRASVTSAAAGKKAALWAAAALAIGAIGFGVYELGSDLGAPPGAVSRSVDSGAAGAAFEAGERGIVRSAEFRQLAAAEVQAGETAVWSGLVVDLEGRPLAGRTLQVDPRFVPRMEGETLWTGGSPIHRMDFPGGLPPFPSDDERRAFLREDGFSGWRLEALVAVLRGDEPVIPSCVTDEEGRYRIEFDAGNLNEWSLTAAEPEWIEYGTASLVRGPNSGEHVVVLGPAAPLSGVVLSEDGLPLSDVLLEQHITLDTLPVATVLDLSPGGNERYMAVTDERGRFSFDRVATLEGMQIRVSREGFVSRRYPSERTLLPVEYELKAEPVEGRIGGTVVDRSGRPVAGARVSFGSSQAETDGRGRFDLKPGQVDKGSSLVAWKRGEASTLIERFGEQYFGQPALRRGIRIELDQIPQTITGRVLGPHGRPMRNCRLMLWDGTCQFGSSQRLEGFIAGEGSDNRRTDAEGRFTVGGLFPRSYVIQVVDPKTLLTVRSEPIEAGRTDVEIRAPKDALIARIEGKVVDRQGRPVARVKVGATVFQHAPQEGSRIGMVREEASWTNSNGFFVLTQFPRRFTQLSLSGKWVVEESMPLQELEEAGQRPGWEPLRIVVERKRQFRLRAANPAEGARFQLLDAEGKPVVAARQSQGVSYYGFGFEYPGLPSATYQVSEAAVTLQILKDKKVVREVPIRLDRDELVTIDV